MTQRFTGFTEDVNYSVETYGDYEIYQNITVFTLEKNGVGLGGAITLFGEDSNEQLTCVPSKLIQFDYCSEDGGISINAYVVVIDDKPYVYLTENYEPVLLERALELHLDIEVIYRIILEDEPLIPGLIEPLTMELDSFRLLAQSKANIENI